VLGAEPFRFCILPFAFCLPGGFQQAPMDLLQLEPFLVVAAADDADFFNDLS
jgi:hypothetical protein